MGIFKFSEYRDYIDSRSKQAINQIAEDKEILGYLTYGALIADGYCSSATYNETLQTALSFKFSHSIGCGNHRAA